MPVPGDLVNLASELIAHGAICAWQPGRVLEGARERLEEAAASHSRRLLALSLPRDDAWWLRVAVRVANVSFRLIGGIETFLHEPARVVAIAESAGLRAVLHERSGRIWRVAVFERA